MKVLIVEDMLMAQIAIKAILEQYGFEVDTAMDGSEGIDKASHGAYSLIIMDIGLPEVNGIHATREMRAAGVTTPVFALTANFEAYSRETMLAVGMQLGYEKPLDPFKLADILYRCCWFLPKNAEILLGKLPAMDSQQDNEIRWGGPFQEMQAARLSLVTDFKTLSATLQAAFDDGDWKALQTQANTLLNNAQHVGALRLELSCQWLTQVLDEAEIHKEAVDRYHALVKESLAQYLNA